MTAGFDRMGRRWQGRPVAILGGGPCLTPDQVDLVRRCRPALKVLAINNAYQLVPDADLLWFCDRRWWDWHRDAIARTWCGGEIWTLENPGIEGVKRVRNLGAAGFAADPDAVMTGHNSGYQAAHLAAHAGASALLLLGYTMGWPGGRTHWHDGHKVAGTESSYKRMLARFPDLADALAVRGIRVWNCSPASALDVWPKVDLEYALRVEGILDGDGNLSDSA